jgi:hypothetical protein
MNTLPSVFVVDPFRPLADDDPARLRPLAFVTNRDGQWLPIVEDDSPHHFTHLPPLRADDGPPVELFA